MGGAELTMAMGLKIETKGIDFEIKEDCICIAICYKNLRTKTEYNRTP